MNVITAENLTKKYGNYAAVDNFSLSVKQGEVFGLLGANGAGKSTTIECISGTKIADSGTVKIFGNDPKKDRKELFQRIGVQFQQCDYQTEIKVYELCEETACLYKEPADWKELCTRFGIGDKLNDDVKNLSGGDFDLECSYKRLNSGVFRQLAADYGVNAQHWNDGGRNCKKLEKCRCYRFCFIFSNADFFGCNAAL